MAEEDPKYIEPKRATPRHIVIKLSKVRVSFEGRKGKVTCHIQGNSHKTVGGFLNRSFAG